MEKRSKFLTAIALDSPTRKTKKNDCKKRQIKSQGSCKSGRHCPARMHCTFDGTQVTVNFTSSHYGHDLNPAHLQLSKQTYQVVAQHLVLGVPREKVTRNVAKVLTPSKKKHRYNLISNKDVDNIASKFNLNKGQYHENDPESIEIFVKEQQERREVIFTLYKKQGEELDGLDKNDFLLGFMTSFQKSWIDEMKQTGMAFISSHCSQKIVMGKSYH